MPISVNVNGVLHQLTGVYSNDGTIIKTIYGTPKENIPLNWSGFTGSSDKDSQFLIGSFTTDSSSYVSFSCNKNDAVSDKYKTASDIINTLSPGGTITDNYIIFRTYTSVWYKTDKSVSSNHRVKYLIPNERVFFNNSSDWELQKDDFTTNNGSSNSTLVTLDEGLYYVFVQKYYELRRCKSLTSVSSSDYTKSIYDLSGLEINLNFKFQTLS